MQKATSKYFAFVSIVLVGLLITIVSFLAGALTSPAGRLGHTPQSTGFPGFPPGQQMNGLPVECVLTSSPPLTPGPSVILCHYTDASGTQIPVLYHCGWVFKTVGFSGDIHPPAHPYACDAQNVHCVVAYKQAQLDAGAACVPQVGCENFQETGNTKTPSCGSGTTRSNEPSLYPPISTACTDDLYGKCRPTPPPS